MSSDAINSNAKLFPIFEEKLSTNDPRLFANTSKKLVIWLSSEKAYYPAAQPKIVALLEVARATLRTKMGMNPNGNDYFHISDCPPELDDWVQSYHRLVHCIVPYLPRFTDPALQKRLSPLIHSIAFTPTTTDAPVSTVVSASVGGGVDSNPEPGLTFQLPGNSLDIVSGDSQLLESAPSGPPRMHKAPEEDIPLQTQSLLPQVDIAAPTIPSPPAALTQTEPPTAAVKLQPKSKVKKKKARAGICAADFEWYMKKESNATAQPSPPLPPLHVQAADVDQNASVPLAVVPHAPSGIELSNTPLQGDALPSNVAEHRILEAKAISQEDTRRSGTPGEDLALSGDSNTERIEEMSSNLEHSIATGLVLSNDATNSVDDPNTTSHAGGAQHGLSPEPCPESVRADTPMPYTTAPEKDPSLPEPSIQIAEESLNGIRGEVCDVVMLGTTPPHQSITIPYASGEPSQLLPTESTAQIVTEPSFPGSQGAKGPTNCEIIPEARLECIGPSSQEEDVATDMSITQAEAVGSSTVLDENKRQISPPNVRDDQQNAPGVVGTADEESQATLIQNLNIPHTPDSLSIAFEVDPPESLDSVPPEPSSCAQDIVMTFQADSANSIPQSMGGLIPDEDVNPELLIPDQENIAAANGEVNESGTSHIDMTPSDQHSRSPQVSSSPPSPEPHRPPSPTVALPVATNHKRPLSPSAQEFQDRSVRRKIESSEESPTLPEYPLHSENQDVSTPAPGNVSEIPNYDQEGNQSQWSPINVAEFSRLSPQASDKKDVKGSLPTISGELPFPKIDEFIASVAPNSGTSFPDASWDMERDTIEGPSQMRSPPTPDTMLFPEPIKEPPNESPPKRDFGAGMVVLAAQQGLQCRETIAIDFDICENQYSLLSDWNKRHQTNADVKNSLCISLGCYPSADLIGILRTSGSNPPGLEDLFASCHSHWPTDGAVFMKVHYKNTLQPLPLSPPITTTPGNLVDLSQYMQQGKNTVEIHECQDMAAYTFVLHAHHPTQKQLEQLSHKRQSDRSWSSWLEKMSKPLSISLPWIKIS
jgi:hypothetical protein